MRITALLALSVLSLAASAPAVAQDAMMKSGSMMHSGSMMKMSKADTKKMKMCSAMSHDRMMKNHSCAKMMKMHSDMMKHDGMMAK